jgi:hypothetical protein
MLEAYFWTAYYPIEPKSTKPLTGTKAVNVARVFGAADCQPALT